MKVEAAAPATPARSGRLTILIIDDDDAARSLFRMMLEQKGHNILTAASGAEGLAIALDQLPDIILCDVRMPAMSGHEVLRVLHTDYHTRRIPFIFLTGCNERHSIRLGMAAGAAEYLLKPFQPEELDEAIDVCRRKLAWFEHLPGPQTAALASCA